MKNELKAGLVLFFLVLVPATSSGIGVRDTSSIDDENNPDTSQADDDRELWYNPHYHRRIIAEVDSGDFYRRWGTAVEYAVDFKGANVDENSIRVIKDGLEIPSDYIASENKIIFVVENEIQPRHKEKYTIYWDVKENGLKDEPVYDPEWVREYEGTNVDTYEDKYETEYKQYLQENQLYEDNGTYHYRESVVYGSNGSWYYENGTMVTNYAILNETTHTWYVYNATGLESTFVEGFDQSVFVDAGVNDLLWNSAMGGSSGYYDNWDLGNVRAIGSAFGDYYSPTRGRWVRENVNARFYRGSPVVGMDFSGNESTSERAWGSALFNLNGTIFFNNTYLDKSNISGYYENQTGVDPAEYGDDYSYMRGDASRIKILSEGNTIDVSKKNDWTVDNKNTFNLTGKYHAGKPHTRCVLVKPFLLKTRYFGMYDCVTRKGFGFVFPHAMAFQHVLVEIWKVIKDDGTFEYYLNVSLNYFDWWFKSLWDAWDLTAFYTQYSSIITQAIHLVQTTDFSAILTYIDSLNPTEWLQDVLGDYIKDGNGKYIRPRAALKELLRELPLPIKVIVNKPKVNQVFKRKEEIEIDVNVLGETVMNIYYKWGRGVRVTFSGQVKYWENTRADGHFAINGTEENETAYAQIENMTGDINLTIMAEDSNGSLVSEMVQISIQPDTTVVWVGAGVVGGVSALVVIVFLFYMNKAGRLKNIRSVGKKKDGKDRGDSSTRDKPVPERTPPRGRRGSSGRSGRERLDRQKP